MITGPVEIPPAANAAGLPKIAGAEATVVPSAVVVAFAPVANTDTCIGFPVVLVYVVASARLVVMSCQD